MKKRDKKRENKEIIRALAMLTQIGLAMMTCMGISFGIGYYIDRMEARIPMSRNILTGRLQSSEETAKKDVAVEAATTSKEESDEGSKTDAP